MQSAEPRDLARRLLSLTGVLPLGGFLVLHGVLLARALGGDRAFAEAVRAAHRSAAVAAVEWLFVLLPLVLHAGLGAWLAIARPTPAASAVPAPAPYPPPVRALVRGTAVVAVLFLAMHLPEIRFRTPGMRLDAGQMATVLGADLSATWHGVPWRGGLYLFGAACVVFHFVAGLWGLLATTARGRDARTRRRAAWAAGAIGGALWLLFAQSVVFHATGSRLFGGPRSEPPSGPCPPASSR